MNAQAYQWAAWEQQAMRATRRAARTKCRQPHCDRVRAALRRLSRDRWLSGNEVRNTALRLAGCVSLRPHQTADSATPVECTVIGMLRGRPPAWQWQDCYGLFFLSLEEFKPKNKNDAELLILQLTIKGLANGRQSINDLR